MEIAGNSSSTSKIEIFLSDLDLPPPSRDSQVNLGRRSVRLTLVEVETFPADTAAARIEQLRSEYVDGIVAGVVDADQRVAAAAAARARFDRDLRSFVSSVRR